MGRLERIIVVGALVTVGALVAMLVWRGLERREAVEAAPPVTEWGEAGSVPLQMTGELPLPAGVLEESAAQDAEAGEGEILEAVAIEPALDGLPVEGAEPAAARTPEPRSRVAPSPPTTYKVRRGDTLSGIAKRELGSAQRWRDIQRLNPDLDPARLRPGQILVLPPRDASPGGGEGKALAAEAAARGGKVRHRTMHACTPCARGTACGSWPIVSTAAPTASSASSRRTRTSSMARTRCCASA